MKIPIRIFHAGVYVAKGFTHTDSRTTRTKLGKSLCMLYCEQASESLICYDLILLEMRNSRKVDLGESGVKPLTHT